jgi:hypothetical protein
VLRCVSGCQAGPTYAAASGNIEIVKFLVEQGIVRTDTVDAINGAALLGQLNVCQYLRTLGCPWARSTSSNAAKSGDVGTLRWLFEHGCPWHPYFLAHNAAMSGSIECMEYIRDTIGVNSNGVMLTGMLNAANCEGKLAAVQWLRLQGADWPHTLGTHVLYHTVTSLSLSRTITISYTQAEL